jgi:hypothetical protein
VLPVFVKEKSERFTVPPETNTAFWFAWELEYDSFDFVASELKVVAPEYEIFVLSLPGFAGGLLFIISPYSSHSITVKLKAKLKNNNAI